jgi:hypothetical protein
MHDVRSVEEEQGDGWIVVFDDLKHMLFEERVFVSIIPFVALRTRHAVVRVATWGWRMTGEDDGGEGGRRRVREGRKMGEKRGREGREGREAGEKGE